TITESLPLADESKDDVLSESIPDTTRNYQEITTCNFVIYIREDALMINQEHVRNQREALTNRRSVLVTSEHHSELAEQFFELFKRDTIWW
ncbi:MAG: hypothetical protein J2P37_17315, partial [Ktedonobacteraceae bacterium]|nr:hypothetical protein [Ktedonobacteraceae bacterium]